MAVSTYEAEYSLESRVPSHPTILIIPTSWQLGLMTACYLDAVISEHQIIDDVVVSVSGEVCEEPVVSKASGQVYEKVRTLSYTTY